MDNIVSNTSYLLAYDAYHGDVLMVALAIIAAVLPGLAAVYLLYSLVTSFIQMMLTDKAYIRWGASSLLALLFMAILLGGVPLLSQSNDSIVKGGNTAGTISAVYLYHDPQNANSHEVSVYSSTPFEAYAYLPNGADTFAYDMGDNSCISFGSSSKMNLYVAKSGTTKHSSMLSTVSSRLQETTLHGDLFRYLSNSATSVMFATAHLANSNLVHSSFFRYVKNTLAANDSRDSEYTLNTSIAGLIFPEVYATELYALNDDQISRMVGSLGGTTRSFNAQTDSVTGAYVSSMSAMVKNSQQGILLSDVSAVFDSARSEPGARTDASLLLTSGQKSFINFRSKYGTFVAACRTPSGYDPSSDRFGSKSIFEVLNPCDVARDDLEVIKFDTELFDSTYSVLDIDLSFFASTFSVRDILEGFDISPEVRGISCRSIDSVDDLIAAYDSVTMSSALVETNAACLELGNELAVDIKTMLEYSRNSADVFDQEMIASGRTESREDHAVLAINFDGSSPNGGPGSGVSASTFGNENLASLNGALRGLLSPIADRWSNADITTKSPIALTNNSEERLKTGKLASMQGREIAGGIIGALTGGGAALTAANVGSTAFGWPLKVLSVVAGTVPSGAVMTSYTIVYYTAIYSSAFGLLFLALWTLLGVGKMMSTGTNSSDRYQGFTTFPIIPFILTPIIIASELVLVGIANGMSLEFFNHGLENMCSVLLTGVLTLGVGDKVADVLNMSGSGYAPLDLFVSAMKPLGIMLGFSTMPMLLYKLSKGDVFSTENDLADRSLIHAGATAVDDATKRAETMISRKRKLNMGSLTGGGKMPFKR